MKGAAPECDFVVVAIASNPLSNGTCQGIHFSSKTSEWPTPQWLFNALDKEFGFTLDPCSTHKNAKCDKHFTIEDDGLKKSWEDETVFMNPPYGREIEKWMKKAYEESKTGATVVCLVPSRTDTRWWHNWAMKGEIRLLKGRVRFEGAINVAPFPTAVIVFRPANYKLLSYSEIRKPDATVGNRRPVAD